MLLVVDANILISALISRGLKQDLLFSDKIEAISPEWVLFEIGKHWKEICNKSKFSKEDLELAFSLLREQIKTHPLNEYSDKLSEAKEICPHFKDLEYFALALKLDCPIWSKEKLLKKQSRIKVFSTKELLDKI
jgi:predicted nucleic acid-binding protein